jgi:hypothetical protein
VGAALSAKRKDRRQRKREAIRQRQRDAIAILTALHYDDWGALDAVETSLDRGQSFDVLLILGTWLLMEFDEIEDFDTGRYLRELGVHRA